MQAEIKQTSDDIIPKYIKLVHMYARNDLKTEYFDYDTTKDIYVVDDNNGRKYLFVKKGTELGYQSNQGNDVQVHLHIEASYALGGSFDPAACPGSLGNTISPYEYMEYAINKSNN